jgi:hypothetical protein
VTDARARRAGDHRAGPHRVILLAEDAEAVALEDDEDLLVRGVAVHRAVELARRDVRVVEPGFDRTRGRAELARAVAELAAVEELRPMRLSTSCRQRMSGRIVPSRVIALAASSRWMGLKSSKRSGSYIGR